ncbi:MAG: hypothetical protein EOP11_07590 [Proteobacteria bacterium]|nr:MAG: hypothetical protein EOP11_07590 [Pseudomonadota bacterium]
MRMKFRKVRILLGQRGDSLVSVMIAAGLLSGTAVVGGGVMKLMKKDASYTSVMSSAIAAESAIMQALQNPSTYANPAHTASMRAGGGNRLAGVNIYGERGIGSLTQGVVLATLGSTVRLNRDGTPCSPGESNPLSSSFCAITTNVDIFCSNPPGVTCRAAYQVQVNAAANGNTPVPPFGAPSWDTNAYPPTPLGNYITLISYDLYRREGAKTACFTDELFITGIDKSNGNITCSRPTNNILPDNRIPTTVTYSGAPDHEMRLDSRPMETAVCQDPKYALQQISALDLDTGGGVPGSCIYRYKPDIPWMEPWPAGRDSVEMNVCPDADYTIVPSGRCTMNVLAQQNGYEPRICQDETGTYEDCSVHPAPVITEGVTYRIDQDPPQGATKPGSRVTCTLVQIGTQPPGASWTGEVQWGGRCVFNRPNRKMNAVRRPVGSP